MSNKVICENGKEKIYVNRFMYIFSCENVNLKG